MAKRIAVEQWPIIWRVVAPACGSYDHDMVFLETESEEAARRHLHGLRCAVAGTPRARSVRARCRLRREGRSSRCVRRTRRIQARECVRLRPIGR